MKRHAQVLQLEKSDSTQDTTITRKKAKIPNISHNHEQNFIQLEMFQAQVYYYHSIFSLQDCLKYYSDLASLPYWSRPVFKIFGRPATAARLTCSFGSTPDKTYRYSGTVAKVDSIDYPPFITIIKDIIESILNAKFNFVLLNWYQNGNDSIGAHADDEGSLVPQGVIACVSFGAPRTFMFQNKCDKKLVHKIILENGSLIVMKGTTQQFWKHSIPKEKKIKDGRISLTFRQLK
ncbi:46138_t:CDS:1 [Gigaspora margarita]|uniref:46138_t:CDS:1 n=2 Tax=Gigaspora margarita TaxID=4874 RepID=A0ABM8W2R9_GIGMA|nr:alpha-ketoglutarate-dependent dioxygenase AlkB [Gigaspora margarita]CAG8510014.1 46138_t:CDS:1 [Gigaspora margarita]